MTSPATGRAHPKAPDLELAEQAARLAAELVEVARSLGDAAVIASAELSAFAAGVALARAIEAHESRS